MGFFGLGSIFGDNLWKIAGVIIVAAGLGYLIYSWKYAPLNACKKEHTSCCSENEKQKHQIENLTIKLNNQKQINLKLQDDIKVLEQDLDTAKLECEIYYDTNTTKPKDTSDAGYLIF